MIRASRMTRDDRRASIVEATMPLLERYGHQLTTKQIAEAAGVAEGTIFRAFDSLDEVLAATLTAALSAERLSKYLAQADFPGTLDGDVNTAFEVISHYYEAVKAAVRLAHDAPLDAAGVAAARTQLASRYSELSQFLTQRFSQYTTELNVAPDEFARLILVLASGQRGHKALGRPPLKRDLLVATILDGARRIS